MTKFNFNLLNTKEKNQNIDATNIKQFKLQDKKFVSMFSRLQDVIDLSIEWFRLQQEK